MRLDVAALGLIPLKLVDDGTWTPGEHYVGEGDQPLEEWTNHHRPWRSTDVRDGAGAARVGPR